MPCIPHCPVSLCVLETEPHSAVQGPKRLIVLPQPPESPPSFLRVYLDFSETLNQNKFFLKNKNLSWDKLPAKRDQEPHTKPTQSSRYHFLVLSHPQQLSVVDAMLQVRIGRCRKFRISGELNSQLFPISPEFWRHLLRDSRSCHAKQSFRLQSWKTICFPVRTAMSRDTRGPLHRLASAGFGRVC